jgi:uncharacterized membrane protein
MDSGAELQQEGTMEISTHDFWTVLHGMGFGALFMLAFSAALAELYRMSPVSGPVQPNSHGQTLLSLYLAVMVILAWLTVFSGAYIVYPWYRAVPPAGITDLSEYPRRLLLSSGKTSEWHNVGMEWKEHVSWIAPISMTMVAYVVTKYGRAFAKLQHMRTAVLAFTVIAFVATGVAGAFGAFLNKYAPVRGGSVIILMGEEK